MRRIRVQGRTREANQEGRSHEANQPSGAAHHGAVQGRLPPAPATRISRAGRTADRGARPARGPRARVGRRRRSGRGVGRGVARGGFPRRGVAPRAPRGVAPGYCAAMGLPQSVHPCATIAEYRLRTADRQGMRSEARSPARPPQGIRLAATGPPPATRIRARPPAPRATDRHAPACNGIVTGAVRGRRRHGARRPRPQAPGGAGGARHRLSPAHAAPGGARGRPLPATVAPPRTRARAGPSGPGRAGGTGRGRWTPRPSGRELPAALGRPQRRPSEGARSRRSMSIISCRASQGRKAAEGGALLRGRARLPARCAQCRRAAAPCNPGARAHRPTERRKLPPQTCCHDRGACWRGAMESVDCRQDFLACQMQAVLPCAEQCCPQDPLDTRNLVQCRFSAQRKKLSCHDIPDVHEPRKAPGMEVCN